VDPNEDWQIRSILRCIDIEKEAVLGTLYEGCAKDSIVGGLRTG
jgi:hypothetical protein